MGIMGLEKCGFVKACLWDCNAVAFVPGWYGRWLCMSRKLTG
jgi:hypothetical protein